MIDASNNINNSQYADQIKSSQANDPKVQKDAASLADIMDKGTVHIGNEPQKADSNDQAFVVDDVLPAKAPVAAKVQVDSKSM